MVDNSRTAAKARSAQVLRNSPRAMPLSGHSSKGATKEQQGIIRCRVGVGGQGSRAAMESPKALMCPLEKGVRGIEISGLFRCSASLTSVSQHGCLVFFRCEAVLLATMNLLL